LEWNNREIANFIKSIYRSKGLPEPSEQTMYNMYKAFDLNNDGGLDVVEAEQLAQGHVSSLVYALGEGGSPIGKTSTMKIAYQCDEEVMVFSKSRSKWMEAKVIQKHKDGSVEIKYKETGEQKNVPLEDQPTAMKKVQTLPQVSPGAGGYNAGPRGSVFEAPLPRHGQNGSAYAVEDIVEVWSDSQKTWVMAKVSCIHTDGRCDCSYLQSGTLAPTGDMKTITLADQAAKMRQKK